eukprot:jgi/Chrzof1/7096/Cz02g10200.t1
MMMHPACCSKHGAVIAYGVFRMSVYRPSPRIPARVSARFGAAALVHQQQPRLKQHSMAKTLTHMPTCLLTAFVSWEPAPIKN